MCFFEILNGFHLIWPFILRKHKASPYKSWKKNFFKIWCAWYQKNWNFALISKLCRSLKFCKREKFFFKKTEFLGTWKVLQKIVFLRKNLLNFLTQEFYAFLKSAQNSDLLIPCTPNFEEIFFNSYKGWCFFFGS